MISILNESFLRRLFLFGFLFVLWSGTKLSGEEKVAEKPPMGWNSYNCFGATVTEDEVKANADFMAAHLKEYGWEYVVLDYCWYYPYPGALNNPPQNENFNPRLAMDKFGRLLPALDRFPSAAGGKGFKPLAEYIHSKGLKFGIHMMRGIPRQAVAENAPVKGTKLGAADIADTTSICNWLNLMYGVDMSKKGAQAYYNSLFKLYAEWEVDYVKVDDLLHVTGWNTPERRGNYHKEEIEAVRKAIDNCGRPMVFSQSPGNSAPDDDAGFLKENTNCWRISEDFWDEWPQLKHQFPLCHKWSEHIGPGHWPDADMLQLGQLSRRGPAGAERDTRFTPDEQKTHMTLWAICRSPLMFGGDLQMIMPQTYGLITNREVIAVNQNSTGNRRLFRRGNHVAWTAEDSDSDDIFLALFNLGEDGETPVYMLLEDLGFEGKCSIRDLWAHCELGEFRRDFLPKILAHGAGLYRVRPQ